MTVQKSGPRYLACLVLALALAVSVAGAEAREARILAMGDSMMAWHSATRQAVSHGLAKLLGEPVEDHSVGAARILYALPITGAMGLNISKQYRGGTYDWVVLNGGGNDLWLGCGCRACEATMGRMISPDGKRGRIPALVQKLRHTGARVVYVGYLRSPGVPSLIDHCKAEGNELERRIGALAELDRGVFFVSLQDLVPDGDRSYHVPDMIHPSVKASRAIAARVAAVIRAAGR